MSGAVNWLAARPGVQLLLLALVMALVPLLFTSAYYYRVGTNIYINALAVTGLVVLIGYAGQVSLGHAGFAGIGAYACALGPVHLGLPPFLSLMLGAFVSGLIAWLVGRPILKLRGHYLAVATLGFGILIAMVLTNESEITGGPDGIAVESLGLVSLVKSLGSDAKSTEVWYWFSGLVLLVSVWLVLNLYSSPSGRALRSLHDSEVAARTIGIDVAAHKLRAFVLSAVLASLSGSMLALYNRFVTPDVAGFLHSIELVTMAVLGGAGSVFGGVLGAFLLTALPQALTFFAEYEHLMLGAIMMLVMIFLRQGLLPSVARLLRGGGSS